MSFQLSDMTVLGIPDRTNTLEAMLRSYTEADHPIDYSCQECRQPGRYRQLLFARMPDRLAFTFQRFRSTGPRSQKNAARVSFPTHNLDMSPYWIEPKDRTINSAEDGEVARIASSDRHFQGPFLYDCYAVICHVGSTLTAGHYISYVRDESSADPTDWIKFDDACVTPIKVGSNQKEDYLEKLYHSKTQQAYMVFYKRQGT